ncbi:MAG: YceI family protein [Solirubrobacteraceae bacterium]
MTTSPPPDDAREAIGGERTSTRWRLDPASSTAKFSVPHFWGVIRVKGHFDRLDGWLETDASGRQRLELTIDAASLGTGNRQRDRHLRSADFFDTQHHPDVRFESTSVSDAGNGRLHVEGELVAAGNRVTLTLEPTVTRTGDRLQIDASAAIDQRELGMTWSPLGMAGTPTGVTVHAELRRER